MKLYTLVCAASFTVCAYSCDRMPFSKRFSCTYAEACRGTIDRTRHNTTILLEEIHPLTEYLERLVNTVELPRRSPRVFAIKHNSQLAIFASLFSTYPLLRRSVYALYLFLSHSVPSPFPSPSLTLPLLSPLSRRLKCPPLLFLVSSP